jgi:hypothetical protein
MPLRRLLVDKLVFNISVIWHVMPRSEQILGEFSEKLPASIIRAKDVPTPKKEATTFSESSVNI